MKYDRYEVAFAKHKDDYGEYEDFTNLSEARKFANQLAKQKYAKIIIDKFGKLYGEEVEWVDYEVLRSV